MRGKGISYDTGFINAGAISHSPFIPDVVRRELRIIRDDLHCNAVRIIGGDAERLELAATLAAEVGLEVWFSPFTCDLTHDEMLALLADCAERAERVRLTGAEVVFVTGGELSLLNKGFLPGETLKDRIELLAAPDRLRELIPAVPARINAFLARAAAVVRERFGGKITYASIPFEGVDWTPFDFVSVDQYWTIEIADRFSEGVQLAGAQQAAVRTTQQFSEDGKPVRYIRSTFVPNEGRCKCLFEAPDPATVQGERRGRPAVRAHRRGAGLLAARDASSWWSRRDKTDADLL